MKKNTSSALTFKQHNNKNKHKNTTISLPKKSKIKTTNLNFTINQYHYLTQLQVIFKDHAPTMIYSIRFSMHFSIR